MPRTSMLWKVALLVGLIMLGTQVCSDEFTDIDKSTNFFAISVEYVVFQFNEDQDDEFAYKFLRVRRSQRAIHSWKYLIDVEMGRTICKKHDEDIDNCPLQQGPGEKKVRCIYIVETLGWISRFTVLNSTCTQT